MRDTFSKWASFPNLKLFFFPASLFHGGLEELLVFSLVLLTVVRGEGKVPEIPLTKSVIIRLINELEKNVFGWFFSITRYIHCTELLSHVQWVVLCREFDSHRLHICRFRACVLTTLCMDILVV